MSSVRVMMVVLSVPAAIAAAVVTAAPRESSAARPAVDAAQVARGKVLVEKLQCTRCHGASGMQVAPASRSTSCSGCHAWISGSEHDSVEYERQRARFPYWERYVENVGSFLAVPDLSSAGARLDPEWVASYVRDPYEVRPGLYERMLSAPVTEEEAASIAAFLASSRRPLTGVAAEAAAIPVSASTEHVAEGARLFASLRCGDCHALGGADTQAKAGAPDLGHTRDRMSASDIAAFIADPPAFDSRLAMPDFDLTAEQAARLRDYVLSVPAMKETIAAVPVDLPLLTKPVGWEEVRSKVFGQICVHCHMTADKNAGEGGPGNTGGLGFAGKGLDLESWDALAASDVLTPRVAGEEAPLIARLRIRAVEHARELAGPHTAPAPAGERGMPMALPALTPVEMQLIRSWIAQGAPGPSGRKAIAAAPGSAPAASSKTKTKTKKKDVAHAEWVLDCYMPDSELADANLK
jgi:mono/diheme cytochrome c family protein